MTTKKIAAAQQTQGIQRFFNFLTVKDGSLNDTALESNKYMKINFDGGELSSDAGLLLAKEFTYKLGFDKILKANFKTNDSALFRIHKDNENLWQMVYQILGAYFEDDCADVNDACH